jgi:acetyltransferase EpsM
MTQPLVLIGGGEHARVVAEAARSRPDRYELRGFVDPAPCEETVRRLGLPRLGDESALREHSDAFGVIVLGALHLRIEIAQRCGYLLAGFGHVIHASAWVSSTARIEPGAVIMAGAIVQTGAVVGAHAIVNSGAVIEHDVQLGAFVHVAPRAVIGGGAQIADHAFVGLGASVRDHVTVGEGALVAMGAVVVQSVPPRAQVKGNPSR